jgi:hypothetical protein
VPCHGCFSLDCVHIVKPGINAIQLFAYYPKLLLIRDLNYLDITDKWHIKEMPEHMF